MKQISLSALVIGLFLNTAIAAGTPAFQSQDSLSYYLTEANALVHNDFPNAIELLDKAQSIAIAENNEEKLAEIAYSYGIAYYVKGDYGNALQHLLESEKRFTALDNKLGMARALVGRGLIQQGLDRHKAAIALFRQAIVKYRESGDFSTSSPAYFNIAISEADQQQYKAARENIHLAIELSRRAGRRDVEHMAVNKLAEINFLQGYAEKAIDLYNRVLFDEIAPNNWEKSFAYIGLAQVYSKQGKLKLAEEHGLLALEYAEKSHSLWDLERNTRVLFEVYDQQADTEKALEYLELNAAYKDSLYDQEKLRELNFLNLESREAENLQLLAEKELAEKRLFVNRVATFLLVLLILFLVMLLILFRKKKRQKEAFHLELTEKNRTILEQNDLIQERNRRLDKANKAKDRFFSIISHDLRSPMGSIQQLLEMMKSGEFSQEEQTELLDEMYQQVSGTTFMLNNLLTWAGTQMDGSTAKPVEVVFSTEVEKVLQAYYLPAKHKNISIVHKKEEGGIILADIAQLSVIIHNLVSNAIKFTTRGKAISIYYQERENYIDMTIADGGAGIPPERIKEILTLDSRMISERGTQRESGTGLGLLVTKEFLKANNADFDVKSRLGLGSQFIVSFPKEI